MSSQMSQEEGACKNSEEAQDISESAAEEVKDHQAVEVVLAEDGKEGNTEDGQQLVQSDVTPIVHDQTLQPMNNSEFELQADVPLQLSHEEAQEQ